MTDFAQGTPPSDCAGLPSHPRGSFPRLAKMERALQACTVDELLRRLATVGARLGTAEERAGDMDLARDIAHAWNNRRTGENLVRDLRALALDLPTNPSARSAP